MRRVAELETTATKICTGYERTLPNLYNVKRGAFEFTCDIPLTNNEKRDRGASRRPTRDLSLSTSAPLRQFAFQTGK
jgi:hypothetical protein